jgi:hypothetical protein
MMMPRATPGLLPRRGLTAVGYQVVKRMSSGKAAAQAGHATLSGYKRAMRLRPDFVERWGEGSCARGGSALKGPLVLLPPCRGARG